jgi:hypothetical protein
MRPSAKDLSNDSSTGRRQLPDLQGIRRSTTQELHCLVIAYHGGTRTGPQAISSDLGFVLHAENLAG